MAKKEKVEIVRSEEFESVDLELADAMTLLDQVNARVVDLLQGEPPPAARATADVGDDEIAVTAKLEDVS